MENPYIGRIVVLLTPLFTAVAGAIVTWVGTIVPGANLDGTELAALFVAGSSAAASAIYKWLDNRGDYEQAAELNVLAGQVHSGRADVPPGVGHPDA